MAPPFCDFTGRGKDLTLSVLAYKFGKPSHVAGEGVLTLTPLTPTLYSRLTTIYYAVGLPMVPELSL